MNQLTRKKPLSSPMPQFEESYEGESEVENLLQAEISRAASLGKPVCEAPEASESNHGRSHWDRILQKSSTLDSLGVSLAWTMVHWDLEKSAAAVSSLFDLLPPASQSERYALPLPLGDLERMVQKLVALPFDFCDRLSHEDDIATDCWLLVTMYGINSLHSCGRLPKAGPWKSHHRRAIDSLRQHIFRFRKSGLSVINEVKSWDVEKELKARKVNYSGEELLQCHPLTLKQILPALPPEDHGGCVNALDWVGEITKDFLLHPERNLVDDVGQKLPKLQGKIHIPPHELDGVIHALTSRNICSWIPLDQVLHYRNQPVLNGMFGVEKPTRLDDSSPVLRVIMNLVPTNSCVKQLCGGTSSLPFIGQWLSVALDENEEVRLWQSDMSAAFYLFRVPEPWWGYLSFNVLKRGSELGLNDHRVYALACTVIPMGFSSSVAVMQEISENLLSRSILPLNARVSRGKPLPPWLTQSLDEQKKIGRAWYHIYLDNFCAGARVPYPDSGEQGDLFHRLAEAAWKDAGVVSSEKKRKSYLSEGCELGSYLNGPLQMMGVSPERILKLAQSTIHLIGRFALNRKMTQVVAGRSMHVFQFRRPLMSCFDFLWSYVGRSQTRTFTYDQIRRELARALCLLPLCHTNLGAKVSDVVTASDASQTGGAVGLSRGLGVPGADFVRATQASFDNTPQIPVLVISLFNGIGGALRCYDILGLCPTGIVIVDICKEANRVSCRRWPQSEVVEDVRSIDAALVSKWRLKYSQITEIHLWAGFPCKDLSSARAFRKNLDGDQSSLFYEVPRIKKLLRKEFPSKVIIKYVLENVASMDREAATAISQAIGTTPYFVDCADAVPMHRPRLCLGRRFMVRWRGSLFDFRCTLRITLL